MKKKSNSELQCFDDCRRKWYLQYYRRLAKRREAATGPRAIGNRVHTCLELHYSPDRDRDLLALHDALVQEDLARFPDEASDIAKEGELSRAMLEGYVEWIAEEAADEGLSIVSSEEAVEVELDLPSGRPLTLMAKLDVLVEDHEGRTVFMDHKTVQDFSVARRLHQNRQMLTYCMIQYLRRAAGEDVLPAGGGLYNMLRKVKRTSRAKPPFFMRLAVQHNVDELRSMYLRVVGELEAILDVEQALDDGADHRLVCWPNPSRDCSWKCDFASVCRGFDDGSDVESTLADLYHENDPYKRYSETHSPEGGDSI